MTFYPHITVKFPKIDKKKCRQGETFKNSLGKLKKKN